MHKAPTPDSSRVFFNLMIGDTAASRHLYLVEDVATKATSLVDITDYDERRHRMVAGTLATEDGAVAVIRIADSPSHIDGDDEGEWHSRS